MNWLLPHPIFLQTSWLTLYTHGVFFALAAEAGLLVLVRLARSCKLPTDWVVSFVVSVFAAGLLGARLGYFLVYPSAFYSISQAVSIWQGGLLSYTGLLVGWLVGHLIVSKKGDNHYKEWRSLIVISVLFAWGIGRLGNYYAADSVGILSEHWQVFYGRVPIQLFESVLCLSLAAIGNVMLKKGHKPDLISFSLTSSYFFGRFLIDSWRDEPVLVSPFHTSQVVSLIVVVLLALAFKMRRII